MNKQPPRPASIHCAAATLLSAIAALNPIGAQEIADHSIAAPENAVPSQATSTPQSLATPVATPNDLEYLVGPYALYPDDLLAVVLAASTHPTQLAEANRFIDSWEERGGQVPGYWDDAVVALLDAPDVVEQMATDLENTRRLGDAVMMQNEAVADAVERLRALDDEAGRLPVDRAERLVRTRDTTGAGTSAGTIDNDLIWAPDCEPSQMTLTQRDPPYRTFPRPCAVYYYPYPEGVRFSSLHFWGATGWFNIGSGVLDFFSRRPWNYRSPYVGFPHPDRSYRPPTGYVPIAAQRNDGARRTASLASAVSQAQSGRSTAASGPQHPPRRAATHSTSPWATAAQRHTNPELWRHGDVSDASGNASRGSSGARMASRGGMSRPRASSGSRASPPRSASSAGRPQVQRSGIARSSAGRQRRQ